MGKTKDIKAIEPFMVYNLDEVAFLLNVDRKTIYRLQKDRKLPKNKVGKGYKFLGEDLLRMMGNPTISRMKPNK